MLNDANICILCFKKTNGINADYMVFLRTVHHTALLGTAARQVQPDGGAWLGFGAASRGSAYLGHCLTD